MQIWKLQIVLKDRKGEIFMFDIFRDAAVDEKEVQEAIAYLRKTLNHIESISESNKENAIQLAEKQIILEQWTGTSGDKAIEDTGQSLTMLGNMIEALDNERLTISQTIQDLESIKKLMGPN